MSERVFDSSGELLSFDRKSVEESGEFLAAALADVFEGNDFDVTYNDNPSACAVNVVALMGSFIEDDYGKATLDYFVRAGNAFVEVSFELRGDIDGSIVSARSAITLPKRVLLDDDRAYVETFLACVTNAMLLFGSVPVK